MSGFSGESGHWYKVLQVFGRKILLQAENELGTGATLMRLRQKVYQIQVINCGYARMVC